VTGPPVLLPPGPPQLSYQHPAHFLIPGLLVAAADDHPEQKPLAGGVVVEEAGVDQVPSGVAEVRVDARNDAPAGAGCLSGVVPRGL
jgi:hypothetical protein